MDRDIKDKNFLQDKLEMTQLRDDIIQMEYQVGELLYNDNLNRYRMVVTPMERARKDMDSDIVLKKTRAAEVGRVLIYSQDYQQAYELRKILKTYDQSTFSVKNKSTESEDKSVTLNNTKDLLDYLLIEGKKGISIQRYKGLGEMNPDQLWETTMDPSKRLMYQVKIGDAEQADMIFSLLMGEDVEPRREFIQNNALEVTTLDI